MKSLAQLNAYSTSSVVFTDESLGPGQVLEDRYQINGLIDTSRTVLENIEKITSAAGSWLSYDVNEGKWGVVINQTGTSVASFSDRNILGNVSISGTGLDDLYNSVKVQFPHRDLKDSGDFVTIEIPEEDRNANEPDNALNISYDLINEPVQANLLGLIELKQSRVNLVVNFRTDFSYVNLKAGDIIDLTNSRLQFTNKLFRIMTVRELQDAGPLSIEITALEYDPNVYSTDDLYRYTRTDANGIISIGSIGTPGTPQVTKFEVDSRPRVLIESLSPTGVVEGMEFWLSYDVTVADEFRTYQLIATVRPTGGGTYDSGETVTFEYDNLGASNFVVKTRGFNASTTGPYSDPSGFVYFEPTQVTDAIGPETGVLDALGGLATVYGAYQLLKGVDDLYKKSTGEGGLFDTIFEALYEKTGLDLRTADEETIKVTTNLEVKDEGTRITTQTSVINFVGDLVTAEASGSSVTVKIGSPPELPIPTITSVTPNYGPTIGGTRVVISGTNFTQDSVVSFSFPNLLDAFGQQVYVPAVGTEFIDSKTLATFTPENNPGTSSVLVRVLGTLTNSKNNFFEYVDHVYIDQRFPPDRSETQDPTTGVASDLAPRTGSYFIKFKFRNESRGWYGPLAKGTGNAKLYKSDGTLVQTLPAASSIITNNVLELPFNDRELGTDYYITIDKGYVNYCGIKNQAIGILDGIELPPWNFNTPLYEVDPYTVSSTNPTPFPDSTPRLAGSNPISVAGPICKASAPQIVMEWNFAITKGAGNIYVKRQSDDAVVQTINVSGATITNDGNRYFLNVGPLTTSLDFGTGYYFNFDQGIVYSSLMIDCYTAEPKANAALTSTEYTFNTEVEIQYLSHIVSNAPLSDPVKINPQTNIGLQFNTPIKYATGNITIKRADGTTHQVINVATSYQNNNTWDILWTSGSIAWINPTKDFEIGQSYYVLVDAGAITDNCGNSWGGISNTSQLTFSIDPGPTFTSNGISDDAAVTVFEYDRTIESGTGKIKIYDETDTLVASIDSTHPSITIS